MGRKTTPRCACGCGEPAERQDDVRCFGDPPFRAYNRGHLFPAPTEPPTLRQGESMEWTCGYILRRIAPKRSRAVHRLIAEAAVGRTLPRHVHVHHVNGCAWDNHPENLVVCEDAAYHNLLHARQRAMEATGDPNAKRCAWCGGYARQEHMRTRTNRDGTTVVHHTEDARDICPRSHHYGRREKHSAQWERTKARRAFIESQRAAARRAA